MPLLGFGVLALDPDTTRQSVLKALEVGYRHFDTASAYGNEADLGAAIRSSELPRSEVFITTKVWNVCQGYEPTMSSFEASLDALQFDYVDLYLAHWPFDGDLEGTWRALEDIYAAGLAKAIGVSNFLSRHLQRLAATSSVDPMVNQVELHPRFQQRELEEYCRPRGIQLVAWMPIMRGDVNRIPELRRLGDKYSKTPVQITLRWMLQKKTAAIPKTTQPVRMEENANVFDFELSSDDMEVVAGLDREQRLGQHPDTFRPPVGEMPTMPWMQSR